MDARDTGGFTVKNRVRWCKWMQGAFGRGWNWMDGYNTNGGEGPVPCIEWARSRWTVVRWRSSEAVGAVALLRWPVQKLTPAGARSGLRRREADPRRRPLVEVEGGGGGGIRAGAQP
uniref:Uncharacterized protein n=1 Tax=Oryza rufipogon TaxID=4529 RepID=A0A0E0PD24_ORYRU